MSSRCGKSLLHSYSGFPCCFGAECSTFRYVADSRLLTAVLEKSLHFTNWGAVSSVPEAVSQPAPTTPLVEASRERDVVVPITGDTSWKSDSSNDNFLPVDVSTSGPPPSVEAHAALEAEQGHQISARQRVRPMRQCPLHRWGV